MPFWPFMLMMAPLVLFPFFAMRHWQHAMSYRELELEMLKAERDAMDEILFKMKTGQYAHRYIGPVGTFGPYGPQGPQGLIEYGKEK